MLADYQSRLTEFWGHHMERSYDMWSTNDTSEFQPSGQTHISEMDNL
jgi:hypothetical protein